MSAILKALRRVESESVQRNETPSVPKKLDARKTLRGKYKKDWAVQSLWVVLLPVLTLAVVIWGLFTYRPFLSREGPPSAEDSKAASLEPSAKAPEVTSEESGRRGDIASSVATPANERNASPREAPRKEKKSAPDFIPSQTRPAVENPELKLQAIVWSEVAENRFAVVNGAIVRSGGRIEGVSVTEIGKDYVSFKSGQRTWNMRMMAD